MLKNILFRADKLICSYLGINGNETERPQSVDIKNNTILIHENSPYHRYRVIKKSNEISAVDTNNYDLQTKHKIGIALGRSIATNLVISFDEVKLKGH
ncbi:TPA: hypothetical protein ACNBBG_003097 [Legionella pneumophila]